MECLCDTSDSEVLKPFIRAVEGEEAFLVGLGGIIKEYFSTLTESIFPIQRVTEPKTSSKRNRDDEQRRR